MYIHYATRGQYMYMYVLLMYMYVYVDVHVHVYMIIHVYTCIDLEAPIAGEDNVLTPAEVTQIQGQLKP